MIPDAILNQIQDRVDIVEVVAAHVPLKRSGRNFKAPCPFHHEKTPSFMVSPDKQIFHCFGCGAGGNVFSFIMKLEKKDFREVVEMLAGQVGVELPKDGKVDTEESKRTAILVKANELASQFYHDALLNSKEGEEARAYFKKRGISQETIVDFRLGYAPAAWDSLCKKLKPEVPEAMLEKAGLVLLRKEGDGFYDRFRKRVIFPILDAKGICLAFGARVLDDSLPKYLNSPETEIYSKGRNLYGLFQARKAVRELDSVIVVEGYMDLIACHQAGVQNVVASLGTALTPDQLRLMKRHTKNVVILYDADKAGELATLRGLELALEEGLDVRIVRLGEGHDPDSFIKSLGPDRFKAALAQAQNLFDYKLSVLKSKFDVSTVEGKVKTANEMVQLLARVPNEILRAAWTAQLARELMLSEEAIISEMRKSPAARAIKQESFAASPTPVAVVEVSAVEKLLLGVLLEAPEWIVRAREELRISDFQNPTAQEIVTRLFNETVAAQEAKGLINFYKDNPEAVRIISLACAEAETVVDKEKVFLDCVLWIKRSRIKNERDGLRVQILQAQKEGDRNRIQELLGYFNRLNKGIKESHEKK